MNHRIVLSAGIAILLSSMLPGSGADASVRLITLDPGHFHAALVQKFMYPQVSPEVRVYAPEGSDLQEHLKRIESFNLRDENPTHWQETVYARQDFLKRMIREKAGNLVVLAGNNSHKTEYIHESIKAGLNVLADKPMAVNPDQFNLLRKSFELAAAKKVLLYDIMTERHEITSIIQRELARDPELFGALEKGSDQEPAVVMESVHHFFKEVAGKPLIRPPWFYDVRQEGEAIPDVGTHLIDLVQWQCFPEQTLDWKKDIKVRRARRWATPMTLDQFKRSTAAEAFPDYFKKDIGADGALNVFQNGDVEYLLRGVHVKVTALWRFEAPPGVKDTLYAMLRGARSTLTIKQGADQHYLPTLYVERRPGASDPQFESSLRNAVTGLCAKWPGLDIKAAGEGAWQIVIPEKYGVGHEAHFAQVAEKYLRYLADGNMPAWEVPNMIAKYYTTTEAYRLSHAKK